MVLKRADCESLMADFQRLVYRLVTVFFFEKTAKIFEAIPTNLIHFRCISFASRFRKNRIHGFLR